MYMLNVKSIDLFEFEENENSRQKRKFPDHSKAVKKVDNPNTTLTTRTDICAVYIE